MSIQTFPECECAGFNPECFGVFINAEAGTLTPANFLQFPLGQGVETLPALIDTGDMEVGNNILMTGIEGVNYIQFPDNTEQFTAYVPAGQILSTSSFTSSTTGGGIQNYFGQVNIVSYPNNSPTNYTLNAFSGGGQTSVIATNPTVPVNGQPFTSTVYGTSASGYGVSYTGVPISTANQIGNTDYAVRIVSQPNLSNPFLGVNVNTYWQGTCSLTVDTLTILSTIGGSTANLGSGIAVNVINANFGCPVSMIITSTIVAGSTYRVDYGQGSNNPVYYINQPLLYAASLPASQTVATFNASLTGGTVTLSGSILAGSLNAGVNHWIYFTGSNVVYFKPATTTTNQPSYPIIGNSSNSPITTQLCYAYVAYMGTDTFVSTWQGSWVNAAIIRGASPSTITGGGSGGTATISAVGTSTTPIVPTIGTAGLTQTTQSYPTGIVNFTNTVVGNSLALQSSVPAINTCANSGAYSLQVTPTYQTSVVSTAGFGGVEVKFYA